MSRLAIIDADSIIYIVGWNCREDLVDSIINEAVDTMVYSILEGADASYYLGFLANKDHRKTFRHKLATSREYKGKRGEKPEHIRIAEPIIRQRLIEEWGFYEVNPEIEVDDACGICHSQEWIKSSLGDTNPYVRPEVDTQELKEEIETILCSPDKDLKQVPGLRYDYRTSQIQVITEEEANFNLWMQVLTGDSTDNIEGIPKIGPKKAEKILEQNQDYKFSVINAYIDHYGLGEGMEKFAENFQLIFILRKQRKNFRIPQPRIVSKIEY